jgi:hypothetical protein
MPINKLIYGRGGKMYLADDHGVLFAEAERFNAQLSRTDASAQIRLTLEDITIVDEITAREILRQLQIGEVPGFSFQGMFKRRDNMTERIVFTDCVIIGSFELAAFVSGSIDIMTFAVNGATDDVIAKFDRGK